MRRWAPPVAIVLILLGLWQLAASYDVLANALHIEPFLVPSPSDIAQSLWNDRSLLVDNGWVTLQEVLAGFAVSVVAGVGFAVVLHISPTLRRAFYPLLVASQTVPIVVVAPILVVWLGFGIGPKLAIIALICFFPITVNTLDGLRSTDPDLLKMMRTLDASRLRTLTGVEAPTALPYFFSGAKIAVAVAVIGAVFGEWAGSSSGLGHLIQQASAQLETALTFAAVVVLSALAILLFGLLALLERRIAWWGPHGNERPVIERGGLVSKVGAKTLRVAAMALAVCAATVAVGCGEKSETTTPGSPQQFTLALDWYVNPDHAGIYEAIDDGYFKEAGLDVQPQTPSDPSAPIREVAAGRVDLAISYEPDVLLAQDQGLPVKAVAALVPTPLTSLIWLKDSGIQNVKDLQGKTIATAGIPYQEAYLKTILDRAGLSTGDVKTVDVQQGLLPAILSGRAQAILGGFLNVEGVDLQLQGKDPTVIPVDKLGIPTYNELVLVANSDTLDDESENIRLFLEALERGTKAAVADPAGATKNILEAGKGLDPKTTGAEVRKTLPLLLPKDTGHPYGYMDPSQWQKFAQFFADNGEIKALPNVDDVLTNDLLPGTQKP